MPQIRGALAAIQSVHVASDPYMACAGLVLVTQFHRIAANAAQLGHKFGRADNQSFLVETVTLIDTFKAMTVDPRATRTWGTQLASYVNAGFRVTQLATISQQGVQLVRIHAEVRA